MEQLLYQLFTCVSKEYGLIGLMQHNLEYLMIALLVIAIVFCLFGFYFYRGAMALLAFLCVALIGSLWVRPAAGEQAAVTFSAVLGLSIGFLVFRWYRVGAVAFSAVIVGSWMYLLSVQMEFPLYLSIALIAICSIAAGVLTFFFPLWSVCAVASIWGGVMIVSEGQRLFPNIMPSEGSVVAVLLMILLSAAGLVCQLLLFKNQKLFPRIMPQRMEYALQKRKEKREEKRMAKA